MQRASPPLCRPIASGCRGGRTPRRRRPPLRRRSPRAPTLAPSCCTSPGTRRRPSSRQQVLVLSFLRFACLEIIINRICNSLARIGSVRVHAVFLSRECTVLQSLLPSCLRLLARAHFLLCCCKGSDMCQVLTLPDSNLLATPTVARRLRGIVGLLTRSFLYLQPRTACTCTQRRPRRDSAAGVAASRACCQGGTMASGTLLGHRTVQCCSKGAKGWWSRPGVISRDDAVTLHQLANPSSSTHALCVAWFVKC